MTEQTVPVWRYSAPCPKQPEHPKFRFPRDARDIEWRDGRIYASFTRRLSDQEVRQFALSSAGAP